MNSYQKDAFIKETRELTAASRINIESGMVTILGREFVVFPKVFDPQIFFSSAWFAKNVAKLVARESSFCEVGCGTGVVISTALLENPILTAVAVDINPYAVENTKENSKQHGLERRLEVYESDVLDSVPIDKKFDSIFWAMPFGYIKPDEEVDLIDLQTFDPGYRAIKEFFETAHAYLNPNGRLLIGFSKEIGTEELLQQFAQDNNFSLTLLTEEKGIEKSPVTVQIYEVKRWAN